MFATTASALLVSAALASSAHAALTLLPSAAPLTHAGNLVTNGSFEIGAPALGSPVFWANPLNPTYSVPPGWSSSGTSQTYATWGGSGVPGIGIRGSAPFPDGPSGLYFGNLVTDVSLTPNFLANGRVTFPGTPVFTPSFGAPCILEQTVNTQLSPATSYMFSFWTSGEDAGFPTNTYGLGVMGLQVTNVLPGDPMQYLSIPSASSPTNSRVYTFSFVPLNPSAPVTIRFFNWGHIGTVGGAAYPFTTELVLDDVIINAVPAPGALGLFVAASLTRRRPRRA